MADAAVELPGSHEVLDRASGENFSVASLLVGRETRRHLMAIYGYARLVDEIGDSSDGDRLANLDAFEADLDRVFDGSEPRAPDPAGAPAHGHARSSCRAGRSTG